MKEIKINSSEEIELLVDFMKTFKGYHNHGKAHDLYANGYHIYLYEGEDDYEGIFHINKD
jgi:hypothetical protein